MTAHDSTSPGLTNFVRRMWAEGHDSWSIAKSARDWWPETRGLTQSQVEAMVVSLLAQARAERRKGRVA